MRLRTRSQPDELYVALLKGVQVLWVVQAKALGSLPLLGRYGHLIGLFPQAFLWEGLRIARAEGCGQFGAWELA